MRLAERLAAKALPCDLQCYNADEDGTPLTPENCGSQPSGDGCGCPCHCQKQCATAIDSALLGAAKAVCKLCALGFSDHRCAAKAIHSLIYRDDAPEEESQ